MTAAMIVALYGLVVLFVLVARLGSDCDHKRKEPGCNPAPVSTTPHA